MLSLLPAAIERRRTLLDPATSTSNALRLFSGLADGMDGLFLDVYADTAVLIVYEGRAPDDFDPNRAAPDLLRQLKPLGVERVYLKPFPRDRSKMAGQLPEECTSPTPLIGPAGPEAILIREHHYQLEIRPYDGLSTGVFLDQRNNRRWAHDFCRDFSLSHQRPAVVLNTFAYTCAFSVAAAMAGAHTSSIDISPRYLDWGKRNLAHNGITLENQKFARMHTFEFFALARKKRLTFDLILLDPPSFSSANKKRDIPAWSSTADYPRLVYEASRLLSPSGVIFASTNTHELCLPNRLKRLITSSCPKAPKFIQLPASPVDFERDRDRFTALAFALD